MKMLKDFIWKTFEKTGNLSAYLLYKEMENEIHSNNLEIPDTDIEKVIRNN